MYVYVFCFTKIFTHSATAKIKFKIITILPTNVKFSVKKVRHHKTFKTPFIINKIFVESVNSSLEVQIKRITANEIYIIVHTIGITIFGIHWLGLFKALNHSIPKFTNTEPSTATNIIGTTILNTLFTLFIPYFM